jgi:DtxR family Mn-dependent transcriptional regulator
VPVEEKNLSAAMEDYIKTIYTLEKSSKVARVSEIGRALNVKKASVVAAVSLLQKNELIKHERYGFITLTERGLSVAEKIVKKNQAVYEFLTIALKIEGGKAATEACGMEHAMSEETADKIRQLTKSLKPRGAGKKIKKAARK